MFSRTCERFGVSHLDLVCVHGSVGDQDLGVLQPLRLVHSDLLVQQETWEDSQKRQTSQLSNQSETSALQMSQSLTFVQVGVCEASPQLLDDVDGFQVPGAFQPHDGVQSQLGEVIFVVSQQFRGQRGAGDVQ